ncbi:MAG: ABC transporter ATP-binding protein [Nitrospirae bacterium]|nr:ABC transporter ATP-binding protein [Nitrospirota bacterium]
MILAVEDISISFGGLSALDKVSFTVDEHEITGVIGPNGAGKTTLFNIITSVFTPSSGNVYLHGKTITALKSHVINKMGVSRTFQNIRLFGTMTVIENVMAGRHARMDSGVLGCVFRTKRQRSEEHYARDKAVELLEFVGLSGQWDSVSGNLSYGMQRRLEIARALASEPSLLLLDEPVAGMNDVERAEIFGLIGRISRTGVAVLLIEHNMPLVMGLCQKIVVLDFGKKIAEGTPEFIKTHPEVIEAYLGKEDDEGG